ncbi:MAG: HAMP domain-containing histidine kinase [Acidobacteria bacterium]|nr:HAMP domain-containing histidine kinase [Acidobacteriota bacterium]
MATTCVLCSNPVSGGRILCDSCDRPRRKAPPVLDPTPAAAPGTGRLEGLVEVLNAGRVAALLIRSGDVVAATEMARQLFSELEGGISAESLRAGLSLDVSTLVDGRRSAVVHGRPRRLHVVSLDADTRVVVFEPDEPVDVATAGLEFIREAVVVPLRSLSQSLEAAGKRPGAPQLLRDAATVIDQSLSTLELSTDIGEQRGEPDSLPTLLENLRERFHSVAERKQTTIRIDMPAEPAKFADIRGLGEALAIYVENALRYVPSGGQIVLGVRTMDHKGSPILLFFVMDNGPIVPEEYRDVIFDPGFVWDPKSDVRTGKDLDQCRRFVRKHGGKAWVESRTGKACTFFMSVPNQA